MRGYKQRSLPGYAVEAVIDWDRCTGPVDEQFLTCFVLLPQNHIKLLVPAPVQLAEA